MTGNIALDVVIGLVFVYLLYSLYATILMELISSLLGLRAKNLRFTLKRMLSDERKTKYGIQKVLADFATTIARTMGWAPNLSKIDLYNAFYQHPTIQSLGSGGIGGKPSYIHAENFSKALIDIIKVDDPDLPLIAAIEIGLDEKLEHSPGVQAHIKSFIKDANNDPVKFKLLIENWFKDTMERSTGWFKQTTQFVILLIGMVLVFSFNLDTLAIVRKLSIDKNAREALVQLATNYVDEPGNKPSFNNKVADSNQRNDAVQSEELKRLKEKLENEINESQSIVQNSWHLPDKLIYHSVSIDSSGSDTNASQPLSRVSLLDDSLKMILDTAGGYVMVHKSIDTSLLKDHINYDKKNVINEGSELTIKAGWYKFSYITGSGRLWGYLLTVLALSLGAPFWFDLLNKLVKLRTGKQVTESSDASHIAARQATTTDILNRVG